MSQLSLALESPAQHSHPSSPIRLAPRSTAPIAAAFEVVLHCLALDDAVRDKELSLLLSLESPEEIRSGLGMSSMCASPWRPCSLHVRAIFRFDLEVGEADVAGGEKEAAKASISRSVPHPKQNMVLFTFRAHGP